jgi:hypothetical protein
VGFLDDIFRSNRSKDPYISELTKAAYQLDLPLDSLGQYSQLTSTKRILIHVSPTRYKSQGLQYPSSTLQTWKSSSPEFQILVGTGFGKVVGAFVLCVWGQGRKQLASISNFHIDSDPHKLYMRFELEDVVHGY